MRYWHDAGALHEALHLTLAVGEEAPHPALTALESGRHRGAPNRIDLAVFELLLGRLLLADLDLHVFGDHIARAFGLVRHPSRLLGREAVMLLEDAAEPEIDGVAIALRADALADQIAR